ncbi:MAG: cytochrome c biogenesis protein [Planctomycetota bacterium]
MYAIRSTLCAAASALAAPTLTLAVLTLVAPPLAAQAETDHLTRTQPWNQEVVAQLATLPVQEDGRIKPLSALAATSLHLTHGRRDMKLDTDGDRKPDVTLTPTEWLLDVWCYPDQAADYPLFRIENVDVFDAIGVPHAGGQSFNFEYLSYRQLLAPGTDGRRPIRTLFELGERYKQKSGSERTPIEEHLVQTAQAVEVFGALHAQLEALQVPLTLHGDRLRALFDGRDHVWLGELVQRGRAFSDLIQEFAENPTDPALGNAMNLAGLLKSVAEHRSYAALFPPDGALGDKDVWLDVGGLVQGGLRGTLSPAHVAMLQPLQQAMQPGPHGDRERALIAWRDAVVQRASERGEYGKVELEDYYLSAAWHYKGLHWFLLAILVVAAGWFKPRAKWLWVLGIASTAVPLLFLVTDIWLRCVIQERPPILRLYDTFLFIGAVGVAAAIGAEIVTRRRVALAMGPIFGALMIALARAFEVGDGKDQMAPLQAVLDTNYYLATHVTSINMGYAAGMLGAFLGTVWLLLNAVGFKRADVTFHKSIVRATYGVVAFGLIFAVFGTIYGGVWANDSWGRFWGWDPKENGALLICIAQVSLLHARMCGWVRDLGFCVGAALTGIIVAFSWFHVNLLEIGLHAYGFSSETKVALFTYYYIQGGLVAVGAAGVLVRRQLQPAAVAAPAR